MKLLLASLLLLSLIGCGTLRGAFEGMKSDCQKLKKVDDWFREHYW